MCALGKCHVNAEELLWCSQNSRDNSNQASIMFHAAMENCRTLLNNKFDALTGVGSLRCRRCVGYRTHRYRWGSGGRWRIIAGYLPIRCQFIDRPWQILAKTCEDFLSRQTGFCSQFV